MNVLAYLHEHGLDAENLMGNRIAVWPEESITPALETWIIQHKSELIAELRRANDGSLVPWRLFIDGRFIAIFLTRCKTSEDAQQSAQQRWPSQKVQVKKWQG